MKAWVLHGMNDFRLEMLEKPVLADDEVLVSVKAAGICGSDILRVYGNSAYSYPLIPGHEFSGMVVELGAGVGRKWMGRRVGIFPMIPCRTCIPCQKRQYELCRHYSYLGSRRNGGFAEYAAVPESNLIQLPNNVTFEEAAMMEPMAVAVHSMRRIMPSVSDGIVIYGLGTIGMLLLMFLMEAGINNILAVGNKEYQKQAAIKAGLSEHCYCDGSEQDVKRWVMEKTDGAGAEVSFECVGKNKTLKQAVSLAAPAGKIVLVGNPYSDMVLEKHVYWNIIRRQLCVMGTWNSSFTHSEDDDWNYVLERLMKKKIVPAELISHKFSMDNLEQGFHIMRDKKQGYLKIMGSYT